MKTVDIVSQLQTIIPRYTNMFSDEISISSLTCSGSTITATTSIVHGLVTGQQVNIVGAITPITITNLTEINGQGVATTASDHDLTLGYQSTVTIIGADQPQYNGTFDLIDVPNRYNFVYQLTTQPSIRPATGTIFLQSTLKYGYNGLQTITVTSPTTFTYVITSTPESPAQGTISLRANTRISGTINVDRFIESYTKQLQDQIWLVVALGAASASKDRFIFSDATYTHTTGQDFRQRIISPFSVYAFIPTINSISGMNERDLAEDLAVLIFKSILRFKTPTLFSDQTSFGITFSGHDFYQYNYAYYIHEYKFEQNYDLTYMDTIDTDDSRAFRDIDFNITSYFDGLSITNMNINLDRVPMDSSNNLYSNLLFIDGSKFLKKDGGYLLLEE
jgi:uncharacterized membrane protein YqgA involved in biofilm formation